MLSPTQSRDLIDGMQGYPSGSISFGDRDRLHSLVDGGMDVQSALTEVLGARDNVMNITLKDFGITIRVTYISAVAV